MIQFNLLPDVKLEYLRTRRIKHTVLLASAVIAGATFGVFVLLFMTVNVFQKQHLNNLNRDIKNTTQELQSIEDLDRVLTVQNQLNKLTELHDNKPVASRLKTMIPQVTPQQLSYASIKVDFTQQTINFVGSADSIKTINKFVDTLKFTKYRTGNDSPEVNAFSSVVLTSFGKDDKGSSYTIDLKFDPEIFSSQSDISFVIPNIITTRSATERPGDDIFTPLRNTQGGTQ